MRTTVPSVLRSKATSRDWTRQSCSITSRGSAPVRRASETILPMASASTSRDWTKTSQTPWSSSLIVTYPSSGRLDAFGAPRGDLGTRPGVGALPRARGGRGRRLRGASPPGARREDVLPRVLPVNGDPLAPELPREEVDLLHVLGRSIRRQVHGGRDRVVDVLLDGRLHANPHFGLDLVRGHEEGGEVVLPCDPEALHVEADQRVIHGEGIPRERFAPPRVAQVEDRLDAARRPCEGRPAPHRGDGEEGDVAQPMLLNALHHPGVEGLEERS